MRNSLKHGFRIGREYLTHWIAAGVILAAPGAAPEHWLADAFHELHVSPELLHLWAAEIDLRVVLSGLGVALIAGDLIWRRVRAQDGVNALAALEEDPTVDMVVSDINMPRTDGLTLLGRPREREDNLATIIVSAYGDMANIRTAMNRARSTSLPGRSISPISKRPSTRHCAIWRSRAVISGASRRPSERGRIWHGIFLPVWRNWRGRAATQARHPRRRLKFAPKPPRCRNDEQPDR